MMTTTPGVPLAPRDRAIALLLGAGLTPVEVAARLGLTLRTVRARVHAIAARLPGDLPAQYRVTVWAREPHGSALEPPDTLVAEADTVTVESLSHVPCAADA